VSPKRSFFYNINILVHVLRILLIIFKCLDHSSPAYNLKLQITTPVSRQKLVSRMLNFDDENLTLVSGCVIYKYYIIIILILYQYT